MTPEMTSWVRNRLKLLTLVKGTAGDNSLLVNYLRQFPTTPGDNLGVWRDMRLADALVFHVFVFLTLTAFIFR